ncbi:DUF1732 domain-containing protein [bacterium]|nr:DUF1732 domain-containing protein [bacterium]
MTGFGRSFHQQNGFSFEVLIKGVNSRFAEFNFKLPQVLSAQEQSLRAILQKSVGRGKVTLTVNGNFEIFRNAKLHCDAAAVKKYLAVCKSLGLPTAGPAGQAARWEALRQPGVLVSNGIDQVTAKGRRLLEQLLKKSLESFLQFKSSEGRKIERELAAYARRLLRLSANIAGRAASAKKEAEEGLRAIVHRSVSNPTAVEDRVSFEIAALLDRMDVSEECSRLNFHIAEFQKTLAAEGGPTRGRKLDFLLQEMHREVNTVGAKGRDQSLSRWTVEAKDLVERMREQVQNVE